MKPRIHCVLAQWIPGFTPSGSPARVVPESLKRFLRQRDNLPGPDVGHRGSRGAECVTTVWGYRVRRQQRVVTT